MPVNRMMNPKKGTGVSKTEAEMIAKYYKDGNLTKKQYDNLPPKLLLAITKKGKSKK